MRYGIRKTSRLSATTSYRGGTWDFVTNKEIPESFVDRGVAAYFAAELSKHNPVGFEVFELEE